ncbi:U32 family peptidase [Ruminococcus sp.]|uniref:peptidase U32 family protein n=1 Tax=Ruminococcus sp. TaxID=41978 RepID=UPI0025CFC83B|nr:U32 family peptidase [Ruminococcus sp.]
MATLRNKPELLAPAGDLERLQAALDYGADAIYLGRESFSMRAAASNFHSAEQLQEAVALAHRYGKKVYLTCNTLPRNEEIPTFPQFLQEAADAGADALILADLGLLATARKLAPDMEIHMSTQTGIVNYASCQALYDMGVKRAVLARELSLEEIAEIRAKIPADMELEVFVHGAMCMSFSGRCLLSAYLTGRDANRGACAQPCRWNYHLMESTRPGQYFPVEETDEGTYIFNAKDLCMIDHLQDLLDAGVDSLKIEGRNKSAYYVAIVTNAYRAALDAVLSGQPAPQWALDEVVQVSHREYCTGFFYGRENASQRYESSSYVRNCDVVAVVQKWRDGRLYLTQRNRFFAGDTLEILAPGQPPVTVAAESLENGNGEVIETANHAMMDCSIACEKTFPAGSVVRKPFSCE